MKSLIFSLIFFAVALVIFLVFILEPLSEFLTSAEEVISQANDYIESIPTLPKIQ